MAENDISIKEFFCGIPLGDLEQVKLALEIFVRGFIEYPRTRDRSKNIEVTQESCIDTFLADLFESLEKAMKDKRGYFHYSYEHSVADSKRQARIEVQRIDGLRTSYLLKMDTEGNSEEEGALAEELDVKRGLQFIQVSIKISAEEGRFCIDCGDIVERLKKIDLLRFIELDEYGIADEFMKVNKIGIITCAQLCDNGLCIMVTLADVGVPMLHLRTEDCNLWEKDGAVIRGPLLLDGKESTIALSPAIRFFVQKSAIGDSVRLPFLTEEEKENARQTAREISSCFM